MEMKKKLTAWLLASVGLATVGSAEVLLDYQFNDANGTEFQNASYSGVGLTATFDKDGNDEWITTNGALRVVQTPGRSVSRWELNNTVTSGVITIDMAVTGYDLSGIAIQDDFRNAVEDQSGKAGEIGFRHATNSTVAVRSYGGGINSQSADMATSGSSVYMRTILDLDVQEASAYYSFDGLAWTAITENNSMDLTGSVYRVRMLYDTDDMAASDYLDVDYLTVTHTIPEPATLGLLAVMGGGALFIRRRFMI
jgi:hypothetical protein